MTEWSSISQNLLEKEKQEKWGSEQMPPREYLLGIDVGTEGCKAILFNVEGKSVARSYSRYAVVFPESSWAEQDPLLWWEGVRGSVKEVSRRLASQKETSLALVPPANLPWWSPLTKKANL